MFVRISTFVTLILMAGVSLFGQIKSKEFVVFDGGVPSVETARGQLSDEMYQAVKTALGLSDAQVNALKTLVAMRDQNIEQVLQSTSDVRKKLQDLLSQTNPNPTEVGIALLAVQDIERQIEAGAEKFRTDFTALLTADQRSALDNLKIASSQIAPLSALGILDGGPHFGFARPPIGAGPRISVAIERIGKDD
jgi:uncharacterized membrane protein